MPASRARDGYSRPRDGCVVSSEPLSALLRGFVDEWNRQRPPTGGRFAARGARVEISMVGAVEWISTESGIPEATVQNIVARPPRHRHTELRIADALVKVIEHPEAFHDGTLEVMPNPLASKDAQAACCSGSTFSLNGSGAEQA